MHFVVGGAFNGKSSWVRQEYQVTEETKLVWQRGFETKLNVHPPSHDSTVWVMEGIEYWIKQLSLEKNSDDVRACWRQALQAWQRWEQGEEQRQIILIGSDITKGIVPIEPSDRKWRDDVGRCYQDLVKACDQVDQIWYGIAKRLKSCEEEAR